MRSMTENLEDFAADEGLVPRYVDARRYLMEDPPSIEPIIPELLDRGDKFFIVGPSKVRKSFFTLQMAICIAAGRKFLKWPIPEPKQVALIQYELKEEHYWRRVRRVAQAMGITPEDIGDRLQILNARGNSPSVDDLRASADVVIVDPMYKMLASQGLEENVASEVGSLLAKIDTTIRDMASTVVIVHHATKGRAGDRAAIDRAAGSGTIARDFDGCITLVPHKDEPDAVVVETILRNYRSPKTFVVEYQFDRFGMRDDLLPDVETSRTAANKAQKKPSPEEQGRRGASSETCTVPMLKPC